MAASVTVSDILGIPAANTLGPNPTPTVTSGTGTSTTNLNCPSCCSNIKYLPGWFGGPSSTFGQDSGICPGAVVNSSPVTLYFTFALTPETGVSLSDLCLPSSVSLEVIADDPLFPSRLRFTTLYSSCSSVSPPTTRLYPTSSNIWVGTQPDPYTGTRGRLQFSMTACDCSGNTLRFSPYSNWTLGYSSLSCSPFSATFGASGPTGYFYQNNVYKGTFTITVTP